VKEKEGFYEGRSCWLLRFSSDTSAFLYGESLDEIRDFFNILGVMKKMCFPNPNGGRGCSKNNVKV